jgi:hypothetical protein
MALPDGATAGIRRLQPVGLQLYTVRDLMKADFEARSQRWPGWDTRRWSSPGISAGRRTGEGRTEAAGFGPLGARAAPGH